MRANIPSKRPLFYAFFTSVRVQTCIFLQAFPSVPRPSKLHIFVGANLVIFRPQNHRIFLCFFLTFQNENAKARERFPEFYFFGITLAFFLQIFVGGSQCQNRHFCIFLQAQLCHAASVKTAYFCRRISVDLKSFWRRKATKISLFESLNTEIELKSDGYWAVSYHFCG